MVEALDAVRVEVGEAPAPAELLAALQAQPGWEWVKTTRRLANLLHPLGIARHQLWNGGRRRWYYPLDVDRLADLRARYGPGDGVAPEGPAAGANAPVAVSETGENR